MLFYTRGERTVHIRIWHTGEKPYICSAPGCGYASATTGNLEQHEIVWHGPQVVRIHREQEMTCIRLLSKRLGFVKASASDFAPAPGTFFHDFTIRVPFELCSETLRPAIPGEQVGQLFRLDILLNLSRILVCLEIDENQHRGKTYRCDAARMLAITGEFRANYPDVRLLWLRFNPNGPVRVDGVIKEVPEQVRWDALANLLTNVDAQFTGDLNFHYMFYNSSTLPDGSLLANHVVIDEITDATSRELLSVTSAQV